MVAAENKMSSAGFSRRDSHGLGNLHFNVFLSIWNSFKFRRCFVLLASWLWETISDCWFWKSNQQSLIWHWVYRSNSALNQIPSPVGTQNLSRSRYWNTQRKCLAVHVRHLHAKTVTLVAHSHIWALKLANVTVRNRRHQIQYCRSEMWINHMTRKMSNIATTWRCLSLHDTRVFVAVLFACTWTLAWRCLRSPWRSLKVHATVDLKGGKKKKNCGLHMRHQPFCENWKQNTMSLVGFWKKKKRKWLT